MQPTNGKGRNAGPVQDMRNVSRVTEDNPYTDPFSRNLTYSQPLKQNLSTSADFSRREASRPLGDVYRDIQQMVTDATASVGGNLIAGTGIAISGNTISVDPPGVTAVGTLTGLAVSGDVSVTGRCTVSKSLITPMQYVVASEAETVTSLAFSPGLVLNPAGTLAALTIVFPGTPVNGQHFSIYSTQNVTALTATAPFVGTGPTSITANVPLHFVWNSDVAGWFKA